MPDLVVTDIGLRRGDRQVLDKVSLTVPERGIAALLGPAGSGKTTLMRALAGLERPQSGTVRLGENVLFDAARPVDPAADPGLGYPFQFQPLWPHRTVYENVAYGLTLRGMGADEIKARVLRMLDEVGLAKAAQRYPRELPVGYRLGVTLARALVCKLPVLLLDDPLGGLDPKQREQARAWLRMFIGGQGVSVLLSTREATDAMGMAERVTLLNAGVIEQDGPPADLYENPRTLFCAEYMGTNNRFEGTLAEKAGERAVIEVAGHKLEGIARTAANPGDRATGVIRVERVLVGGGPGPNRLPMRLTARMYLGERSELVFAHETAPGLLVRAHANVEPRYDAYHVEFPAQALWVF
jgi:iron(III) transport system ATP-binding protein